MDSVSNGMLSMHLRSDRGDVEFVYINSDEASCPPSIAQIARDWGESRAARSVWFRIEGAAPATLDLTDSNSWPISAEA